MKNVKQHLIGDIVFKQFSLWPVSITRYRVTGVRLQENRPTGYVLESHDSHKLPETGWEYQLFDNIDEAYAYRFIQEYHPFDQMGTPKSTNSTGPK